MSGMPVMERSGWARGPIAKKTPHGIIEEWVSPSLYRPLNRCDARSGHHGMQARCSRDSRFKRIHIKVANQDCPAMATLTLDASNLFGKNRDFHRLVIAVPIILRM
jgi:hypothetical protein